MALASKISIQYAGHDTATRPGAATVVAAYNASLGELVTCSTAGGAFTVTLPTVADGQRGIVAIRLQAGTAPVTVDGYGAETVDGAASSSVAVQGETRVFVANGSGAWSTQAGGGTLLGLRQIVENAAVNTVADAGAATTIPEPSVYALNDLTLTEDCTLTFPGATQGKTLRFVTRQGGVGGWGLTYPAGTIAVGGAAQPTAAAGSIDYFEAFSVVEDVWMVQVAGAAYA